MTVRHLNGPAPPVEDPALRAEAPATEISRPKRRNPARTSSPPRLANVQLTQNRSACERLKG